MLNSILHFCVCLYSNVESKASRIKAFPLKSYFFTMAMDKGKVFVNSITPKVNTKKSHRIEEYL